MVTKPISTCLSNVVIFVVRLFIFILFGNPLSMLVLNLLAPSKTAKFAKQKTFFGEKIYAYYAQRALKWPFFWSRWWMEIENIAQYPVEQQIKYFFKIAIKNQTAAEVLKAMKTGDIFWPKAYNVLFFEYGNKKLPDEECRSYKQGDNDTIVAHIVNVTIAEFMMRNVRLSWTAMQVVIKNAATDDDMRQELKKYLARGKICSEQFKLLINSVATTPDSGNLQMLDVLIDYVKRYGISEKHMEIIYPTYPLTFIELIKNAQSYANEKRLKACMDNKG